MPFTGQVLTAEALALRARALSSFGVRGRMLGFVPPRSLACPEGHHIREDTFTLTQHGLRCKHRMVRLLPGGEKSYEAECGALLYVLGDNSVPTNTVFVAEVTLDELRYFQDRKFVPMQILTYLGLVWPRIVTRRPTPPEPRMAVG